MVKIYLFNIKVKKYLLESHINQITSWIYYNTKKTQQSSLQILKNTVQIYDSHKQKLEGSKQCINFDQGRER